MTLEEARKLEAGKQLDRLVGEKVMGCYVRKQRGENLYELVIPGGVNRIDFIAPEHPWSAVPKYSADIAAAWEVAGKLPERWLLAFDGNWHVRETLCVTHDGTTGEARYATKPIASGETAPMAICRAALKLCWQ